MTIFLVFVWMALKQSREMKGFFSRTNFKQYGQFNIKTRFKDVAGCEEAKEELVELVDFLKDTLKYIKMGAKMPRGALLVGPPGTGKTLLAKATAGEAGVPFFSVSGSEFVEGFVGVGAKKVRDLFQSARENAPSIIFIDEIDAVGRKRGQFSSSEKDNTLNQLLVEMDGFGTTDSVIVLGATNMASALDDALTRSGRFDRNIELILPDKNARKEILKVHLAKIKLKNNDMDHFAERVANLTPGLSGAELANVCNEAAIVAARAKMGHVDDAHFDSALERVLGGIETKKVIPPHHKRRIAFYETAKVVVAWFLETQSPALKISLIPRSKMAKGSTFFLNKDQGLQTKEELIEKLAVLLAGKVAEELFDSESSSLAETDLKRAYDLAHRMVTKLGMSDEIGLQSLEDKDVKVYNEHTNVKIDQAIHENTFVAQGIAKRILEDKKKEVVQLSELLFQKETLEHEDILRVLGARSFDPTEAYKNYLEETAKGATKST
jgi:AFG3 family protein